MKKLIITTLLILTQLSAITYEYDELNRLKTATYENGVVYTYSYDNAGNLQSITSKGVKQEKDTDGDGVTDTQDTFPNDPNEWQDTDKDGIGDNADIDDDNDGISDTDELKYGLDPKDPSDAKLDSDGDGVSNIDEMKAGTDPTVKDTTTDDNQTNIKKYTNTSFYVAYDENDKTQYALVMPSVHKIYTHKAGDIKHLHRVDSDFVTFPTYNNGEICFSELKDDAKEMYGTTIMQNECYDVNFFYTQKEKVDSSTAFILYYRPNNKVYEGLAGQKDTFKVVKDRTTIKNENSITKEDYRFFKFDIESATVKIFTKCDNVNAVTGECED